MIDYIVDLGGFECQLRPLRILLSPSGASRRKGGDHMTHFEIS